MVPAAADARLAQRVQLWSHLCDHGQVLLALVPVECLFEREGGVLGRCFRGPHRSQASTTKG